MASARRNPGSTSGRKRSAKARSLAIAELRGDWISATCCMSHLFLSPGRGFVAEDRSLGDFLLLDEPQKTADVQSQVTREKACDALDVQRPVREVRTGVRRALNDPDLARTAIRVVQAPAVVDIRDPIAAAVNEEQRSRLERAQDRYRAAFGEPVAAARAQHQPGQPHERRARQSRSRAHVLDEQGAQVAER